MLRELSKVEQRYDVMLAVTAIMRVSEVAEQYGERRQTVRGGLSRLERAVQPRLMCDRSITPDP